jgi:hypothetical protein
MPVARPLGQPAVLHRRMELQHVRPFFLPKLPDWEQTDREQRQREFEECRLLFEVGELGDLWFSHDGKLFFMRDQDLRARRFDRAWVGL